MFSRDLIEKQSWCEEWDSLISKFLSSNQSETIPAWKVDEDHFKCDICSVKFDDTNVRLHCRSCGIFVCASCSPNSLFIKAIDENKEVRVCSLCYVSFYSKKFGIKEMFGTVSFTLISAKSLINVDMFSVSDPYVVLTLGSSVIRSRCIDNNLNPVWNETYILPWREGDKNLIIQVFDYDIGISDGM